MENCSFAAAFLSVPVSLSLFCPVTLSFISHHQSGCIMSSSAHTPSRTPGSLSRNQALRVAHGRPLPSSICLLAFLFLPSLPLQLASSALPQGLCPCCSRSLDTSPLGSSPTWLSTGLTAHLLHVLIQMSTIRKASLSSLFVTIFPTNPHSRTCTLLHLCCASLHRFHHCLALCYPSTGCLCFCLSPFSFMFQRIRDVCLNLFIAVSPAPGTELVLSKYLLNT